MSALFGPLTPAQTLLFGVGLFVVLWEFNVWATTREAVINIERLGAATSEANVIAALQGLYLHRIHTTVRSGVIMGCTAMVIWVFGL